MRLDFGDSFDFEETEIKKLVVSFSGGRTSAMMSKMIKDYIGDSCEILFVFANTGQEDERTLIFVNECDKRFGLNVVWLEAVVHDEDNIGTTHRVVNFETASRDGEPYEQVMKVYGIANKAYPHCNRELKLQPIKSYMRSIGWISAHTAIGIRSDEPRRLPKSMNLKSKIVYPLAYWWPRDSDDVDLFWDDMDFKLGIDGLLGNCVWCWKKSDKKLYKIASDNPEYFDFPMRMEQKYGMCGNGRDVIDQGSRVFFRRRRSTLDILDEAKMFSSGTLSRHVDDADSGCSGSCEIINDSQLSIFDDL